MDRARFTRRRFLELSAAAGLAAACAPAEAVPSPGATPTAQRDADPLAGNIVSGGPPKDGIPPIDQPRFVASGELDRLLKPEDRVFILDYKGELRAYPQLVLVWHEIVNDEIAGEQLSVTYCPLTGSTVAFKGRAPDGQPLTFGTSGKLVNSNLLMYDRQTDSQWPQILARAITGPMAKASLEEIPMVWTTWERWKAQAGARPVLSTETGALRAYGRDPYGSYSGPSPGYYEDPGLFFPVTAPDGRFPTKEVVIGVKQGAARLAIPKQAALKKGAWNLDLAGQPIVAVRDAEFETIWVFERRTGDETLEFRPGEGGALVDRRGRPWRRRGLALQGPEGSRLPALPFYDVMWFAWYAFFPDTAVAA